MLNRGHGLNQSIVYGPVWSRRYGTSLGINLLPPHSKCCSFNCVYCQLGWNDSLGGTRVDDFPTVAHIGDQLRSFLDDINRCRGLGAPSESIPYGSAGLDALDHIVISGNGEPTMHPDFSRVIEVVQEVKAEFDPALPLVCLTNGAHLHEQGILQAMQNVDECSVKVDACWSHINRPVKEFQMKRLLKQVSKIKFSVVQSCFVAGQPSSTNDKSINDWIGSLKEANPKRLDIYTVTRETAAKNILPVSPDVLSKIAERIQCQVSFPVRVV